MNRKLVSAVILGFGLGLLIPVLADEPVPQVQQTYCEGVEQDIKNNRSFEGTVDCFEPSEVEAELPERVNQSAELRCVCRKSVNGSVQWLNIAVSD